MTFERSLRCALKTNSPALRKSWPVLIWPTRQMAHCAFCPFPYGFTPRRLYRAKIHLEDSRPHWQVIEGPGLVTG